MYIYTTHAIDVKVEFLAVVGRHVVLEFEEVVVFEHPVSCRVVLQHLEAARNAPLNIHQTIYGTDYIEKLYIK